MTTIANQSLKEIVACLMCSELYLTLSAEERLTLVKNLARQFLPASMLK